MSEVLIGTDVYVVCCCGPEKNVSIYQKIGGNLQVAIIDGQKWFRRQDNGQYEHPDKNLEHFIDEIKRRSGW